MSNAVQQRFMDEIDAASCANRWIEQLVESQNLFQKPGVEITSKDGVVALWKGGRPIALAILLRDPFNWTVLTRIDLTTDPGPQRTSQPNISEMHH